MTEQEMEKIILRRLPQGQLIPYDTVWIICGRPQMNDGALFDRTLGGLVDAGKISSGAVQERHKKYSSMGYGGV